MVWRIEFSSTKFLPTCRKPASPVPAPTASNWPCGWPRRCAASGIVTSYPNGDDWGWCLDYQPSNELSFIIGCASQTGPGAGYDGEPVSWSVFVRERRGLERRIRNVSNQTRWKSWAGRSSSCCAPSRSSRDSWRTSRVYLLQD